MDKILITGGTGYIGSHTAVELLSHNYNVDILDNLYNSQAAVVDQITRITGRTPKLHHLDLLDRSGLEQLFKTNHYNTVIHFAGLKAVAESVTDPLKYYENNVTGTINLLKAMHIANTNRIIFSSSATVYGEQPSPKYVETMETGHHIASPYGKTKHMIEEIIKDEAIANPNFSAVLLRYFNPIGAHSSGLIGESPNSKPNNLMPIIMKVHSGEIPILKIYGDDYPTPDGTCIRDYIHVVDLANGHISALQALHHPGIKIYNLGTGHGTSVLEMIHYFETASNKKLPCKIVSRRPGDLAEFYADPTKAQNELNWHAERTIEDAMNDTLNFLHTYNS